jgi:hypothetical protein
MKKIVFLSLGMLILPSAFFCQSGESLNFDGVDDQVTLVHFPRPQALTIEAWIKTTFGGTGQIVGWAGNTSNSAEFKIIGGEMHYFEWDNTNWVGVPSLAIINDGQWHHVAVVRTPAATSNVTLFVDGFMTNYGTVNLTLATNALNIGAYNYAGLQQFFEGSIDEVRIWNRALCDGEIQIHTHCELSGTEYGLMRYYNFNQGLAAGSNGTVTQLLDGSTNHIHGVLNNFALAGGTSNWVAPGPFTSGTACPPFTNGLAVNSPTVCRGNTVQVAVSGSAYGYTWMPAGQHTSVITVSPLVTSVYTVGADVGIGCTSFLNSTVTVVGPTVQITGPSVICNGDQIALVASGASSYSWSTLATNPSLVVSPGTNTVYTVTGTVNGCASSKSFTVSVDPCTSAQRLDGKMPANFFPSPTTGEIRIYGELDRSVLIYDYRGMAVKEIQTNELTRMIDISDLPDGIYLVRLTESSTIRIVKSTMP